MWSFSFISFEFWSLPIFLTIFFFFFFIRSLLLLGDFFSVNPFFEKKRVKFNLQLTSFSNQITPLVLVFCILSLFRNTSVIYNETLGNVYSLLPLFFFILYWFLRIGEKTVYFTLKSNQNQNINSSGLFLTTFIPVATAMISATNLIDLLLPLELLGILFYFIFLEFSYNTQFNNNSKTTTTNTMRGLLYYFWLSFIGSALFVTAIAFTSIHYSSINLQNIYLIGASEGRKYAHTVGVLIFSLFLFLGITLKIGGFFFFFFKAELYKLLPMYGIILFSLYSVIFYLFLFVYLAIQLPFFLFYCKWFLSVLVVFTTIWLFLFSGVNIKNIYVFAGLSSVLTVCFCILIIV